MIKILVDSNKFTFLLPNIYIFLLEPGSIVEKEGWEIRWAKPIGASKILERQRHIREAVESRSSVETTEKSSPRQVQKKKRKALVKSQDDENVYMAQMKVLQNFVKERFDATCTFDFVPVPNSQNFVGRVSRFTICKIFYGYSVLFASNYLLIFDCFR